MGPSDRYLMVTNAEFLTILPGQFLVQIPGQIAVQFNSQCPPWDCLCLPSGIITFFVTVKVTGLINTIVGHITGDIDR